MLQAFVVVVVTIAVAGLMAAMFLRFDAHKHIILHMYLIYVSCYIHMYVHIFYLIYIHNYEPCCCNWSCCKKFKQAAARNVKELNY